MSMFFQLHHGAFWQVPTGRRDGRVSLASEAARNLPPPFANITQLKAMFNGKGLSVKDLAVLSGRLYTHLTTLLCLLLFQVLDHFLVLIN